MEKKIGVIFTKIPRKEWKNFKTACVQAGKPMTEVLWKGAQMYLTAKSVSIDPPYTENRGDAIYVDPLDWAKEGREGK